MDDVNPEPAAAVPHNESYVNLRFGIGTLMNAMKIVAGVGASDMQRTKAELLDSFHGEVFKRRAGQSILDWNTDFRKMLVRLKEAQVIIYPEEAGWKLKHRMGLSQGRMELLDVAAGSCSTPRSSSCIPSGSSAPYTLPKRTWRSEADSRRSSPRS